MLGGGRRTVAGPKAELANNANARQRVDNAAASSKTSQEAHARSACSASQPFGAGSPLMSQVSAHGVVLARVLVVNNGPLTAPDPAPNATPPRPPRLLR